MEFVTDILRLYLVDELRVYDGEEKPEFMNLDNNCLSKFDFDQLNFDKNKAEIYVGKPNLSPKEKFLNFICGAEYLIDRMFAMYEIEDEEGKSKSVTEFRSYLRGALAYEYTKLCDIAPRLKKENITYENQIFEDPVLEIKLDATTWTEKEKSDMVNKHGVCTYGNPTHILVRDNILEENYGACCLYHEVGHYLDRQTLGITGGMNPFGTRCSSISCDFLRLVFNDFLLDF